MAAAHLDALAVVAYEVGEEVGSSKQEAEVEDAK